MSKEAGGLVAIVRGQCVCMTPRMTCIETRMAGVQAQVAQLRWLYKAELDFLRLGMHFCSHRYLPWIRASLRLGSNILDSVGV